MNKIIKGDKKILINRLWFLTGLVIFFLFSLGLTREVVNRRQINRQISEYQERIAKLKIENEVLADKIDNWSTSGELEMNARIKLGLEKPGEKTIIINRTESELGESVAVKSNQEIINLTRNEDSPDYRSNVDKWWGYFFK